MERIKTIKSREIPTSKGVNTVEVEMTTKSGRKARASVPSGVSIGEGEAVELKAKIAVYNVREKIAPKFLGFALGNQRRADNLLLKLDQTKNKAFLGGNAILAVSICYAKASALSKGIPLWKYIAKMASFAEPGLPSPSLLLIEGGKHSHAKLAWQEFMFIPKGESFAAKIKAGRAVFEKLREILVERGLEQGLELGLEGAFTPNVKEEEALDLIWQAINRAGQRGQIGIDAAASAFSQATGSYFFQGKKFSAAELADFYCKIIERFPILFLEDPFDQSDLTAWSLLREVCPPRMLIVGDDLTATNQVRMKEARKAGACNAMIIKPNQIGTLSETIAAANLAKRFGWLIIVSHRAGETRDSFIADLAVGLGAPFIKSGAVSQGVRMAKYNRLLAIEEEFCYNKANKIKDKEPKAKIGRKRF